MENSYIPARYICTGYTISDLKNQKTGKCVMLMVKTNTMFVADTSLIHRRKYVEQINSDDTGAGSGIRNVWIECGS